MDGLCAIEKLLNTHVKADYIFSIDADEALDQSMINDLLRLKQEGLDGIYEVSRKTNYCGKWIRYCGWYPEYKLRLFPKHAACWEGILYMKHYPTQKFDSQKTQRAFGTLFLLYRKRTQKKGFSIC